MSQVRNNIPVFQLYADTHENLPKVNKVINLKMFEYYLWVRLPENVARRFQFYQLDDISGPKVKFVDTNLCYHREGYRPWLRFNSGIFDRAVGKHVYRLGMIDVATHDTCYLYISYIIQSDSIDKPYVYMERPEGSQCACNQK